MKTDILIIGGGPVGITVTKTLKKLDQSIDITMLRPEDNSVIYCAIPYVIEGLMDIDKIKKKDELVTGTGARLIRDKAISADFNNKMITTKTGETLKYNRLIIATGASPILPPIPGIDKKNIFTVKTIEDTKKILDSLGPCDGKAVVVGAGAIGIEQALAYRSRGIKTVLIDMATHPLPNMLDKDFGEIAKTELLSEEIDVRLNVSVKSLVGKDFVEKVILSDDSSISLDTGKDFVVFAVGMRPNIELFKDSGLEIAKDGIIVNEKMKTNIKDVYAAGDVVSFHSFIDRKNLSGKLATNAVPMGKVLARNILGKKSIYDGFINGAATVVGKKRFGGTGFTSELAKKRGFDILIGYGETTSRFPIMPDAKTLHVKIISDIKGNIIGGQVVGSEAVAERIDVISTFIQNKLNVYDMSKLSYSAQPWQTFFPARNAIVQAAEEIIDKLENIKQ